MKKTGQIISVTLFLCLLLLLIACENKAVINVDGTPPVVSISYPQENATIYGTILISVETSDDVGVIKLEIYIDGLLALTDDSPPGEYTWDTTLEDDGNHTLLAKAYDEANNVGISSTINITVANSFEVTFNNQAFTEIELTVAGQGTNKIDAGSSLTLTYSINPGSLECSGETSGETSPGDQIGEKIIWDFTEDVSGKLSQTFNLIVDSDWFFIFIRNNGPHDLSPFYVNYNTSYQTRDDIFIPADGTKYQIGYYKAFSNTEIRAYWYNSSNYSYWVQGSNFTLPFTENQSVALVNNSLQGNSFVGEDNQEVHNVKCEPVIQHKPVILNYKNLKIGKAIIGKGIE
ncbi:Ig-like domain-containing protein [candidate division KSB1 bacterium]|nr:Ig-like domain-containing protein [candidate division KSB1 bacterium]